MMAIEYTIPEELTPVVNYIVQGNENVFTYKFFVVASEDLYVFVNGNEVSKNFYTETGINDENGGTVTIDTNNQPLVVGDVVTLSRFTLPEQLTKFLNTGDFTAKTINAEFNRIYSLMQEQRRDFSALDERVTEAESRLDGHDEDIVSLHQADAAEAAARLAGDQSLQEQINAEAAQRIAEDEKEKSARIAADQNLQAQITGSAPIEASEQSPIAWHSQIISNSVTIPDNVNARSYGPEVEIAEEQEVQVGNGSTWTILD